VEFTIRRYKQSDLGALLRSGYPFYVARTLRQRLSSLLFSNEHHLVASVENEVAGTLTITKCKRQIWEIRFVYTNPSYRRRGIASGLLSYAIRLSKRTNVKKLILDVKSGNEAAKKLYEKLGFTNVISFTWGEGPTDIKLRKDMLFKNSREEGLVEMYRPCVGDNFIRFFDDNNKAPWHIFIDRLNPFFYRITPLLKKILSRSVSLLGEKEGEAFGTVIIRTFLLRERTPLLVLFTGRKDKEVHAESLFGSSLQILRDNGCKRAKLLIFDENIDYYQDLENTLRSKGWKLIQQNCMGICIR